LFMNMTEGGTLSRPATILAWMKLCGRCGRRKALCEFHLSTRSGHQAWCKACRKEYARDYHRRTREIRIAQKKRWQKEYAAWGLGLKVGRPCTDCGRTFHPTAMQWDHLPGTDKVAEISTLINRRHNKSLILDELAKCELVCANCHALRSYQRRGA
jgi:hypothetical protein